MSTMASQNQAITKRQTDWRKCCLGQKEKKNENMTSPLTHHAPECDGYTMIATNATLLHEMSEMPLTFDTAKTNKGGGIEEALRKSMAKYHTNCRLVFNNTKLECARKQHSDAPSELVEKHAKHSGKS